MNRYNNNAHENRSDFVKNNLLISRKLVCRVIILLLCVGLSSCDGMGEMYDDLTQKVPICVDLNSTATNPDGRGWKNAYKSLYDVLNVNQKPDLRDGAEIWVKAGTYTLTGTITMCDRSVSVYGGFNGTESRRDQRSRKNITIIDQDSGNHIAINSFANGKTILFDGFTITGDNPIQSSGVVGATITFRNCKFENITYGGSGAAIQTASPITISNCEFNNCTSSAGIGGAIYVLNSTLNISNSRFTNNSAALAGGAIYCNAGSLTISGSVFGNKDNPAERNETVSDAGGAIFASNCDLDIEASQFYYNHAGSSGGGISYESAGTGNIRDCSFIGNSSDSGGGGINTFGNIIVSIENTIIRENAANTNGGGICVLGGSVTIVNSRIENNSSINLGGGIHGEGATTTIIVNRSIISGNKVVSAMALGGGINQNNGSLTISNSLISNNACYNVDGTTFTGTTHQINVITLTMNNCTVISYISGLREVGLFNSGTITNCVIYGSFAGIAGCTLSNVASNLSLGGTNPKTIDTTDFVDFAAQNYRPSSSSPLRNAGTTVSGIGTLDLDGNQRVRGAIDIGAYEAQ
jgi:predicted outer membrane repeat protein